MKPRTTTDWSKHVLEIFEDMDPWGEARQLAKFAEPGTNHYAVWFSNFGGHLHVTGDLGTWTFSREFWLRPGNQVSDNYWCEKIGLSCQKEDGKEFDQKEVRRVVDLMLSDESEEWTAEEIEYLEGLKTTDENEFWYNAYAHGDDRAGRFSDDHEGIPDGKILNRQLACVFDAFEYICANVLQEVIA